MRPALGQALAATDRGARMAIVASAWLRLVERIVLVVVAISFVHAQHGRALAVTAALAALHGAHGALRASLRKRVYASLVRATVRALLARDALNASTAPADDEQQAVFEGMLPGAQLVAEHLPDFVGNGVAALALTGLLAQTHAPGLLALGALAVLVAALAAAYVRRVVMRIEGQSRAAFVPVIESVVAAVRGQIEIVASGRAAAFTATSDARTAAWRRVSSRGDRIAGLAGRTPVFAGALAVGLVIMLERASGGKVDAGALADAAVFASVVPSFAGAARAAVEMARASTQFERLRVVLGDPGAPFSRGTASPSLPAAITFSDVDFVYPGASRSVLGGVSLVWNPRQALVVTGPNGAGKSTFLRLLLGLGQPTSGRISVGGTSLSELDLAAWRRSLAYLAQRPYLPERATVREAIALFALDVPDVTLRAALARVGVLRALEEIAPADPLGARIGMLSIGQRQRVAIARVLCHDAPVVLLDEPDANLDAAGIALVAELVRELAQSKMVVVVAHTEALVRDAGTVLRLGDARRGSDIVPA